MVEIVIENIIKTCDTLYTPKKTPRFYSPREKKTVLEGGVRVGKGGGNLLLAAPRSGVALLMCWVASPSTECVRERGRERERGERRARERASEEREINKIEGERERGREREKRERERKADERRWGG